MRGLARRSAGAREGGSAGAWVYPPKLPGAKAGKRLFLAVDVDEPTRDDIDRISSSLRQGKFGRLSWVQKDRLHLTLHFFGDADEALEQRIRSTLAEAIPVAPFTLAFKDLGFFPESGPPRVLWLGISDGADQLRVVQNEFGRRLGPLHPSHERFSPHLTLARFRERVPRGRVAEIAQFPAAAGPSPIDRVTLYESRLSPEGSTYVALAEALLQASK